MGLFNMTWIWTFSINGDTPKRALDGLFHGKSQSKMDNIGGSPISGNLHMRI
jgi:hypothetical protein